ncbi:MAG: cytochrome c biogenesis protein ResB [Proteobacteria bacterium]|nr:cytochrome c biogenesis protein ResB [Pseudomonadota bacterium]MBU1710370.1 cytochrome c biogenesis protein ResB [Pseudomonadota bacterium]
MNIKKIWDSLASVKLTLFVLISLALASIIGTLIPQNQPEIDYIRQYGDSLTRMFKILDFTDMYSSWWFTGLLLLFSINLIVCTIDRLPNVIRLITTDNLNTDRQRIAKMAQRHTIETVRPEEIALLNVQEAMSGHGWKTEQATLEDGGKILFSQKGAWTRLGPYIVHISILIIFIGAVIGSFFGYKGSVYIPETTSVNKIYEFGTNRPIPLGFEVRCDNFRLSRYKDGSPSEYRSDLTVIDNGKEVLSKSIVVNDPLDYKGFTFYQSSYDSQRRFLVKLKNNTTNTGRSFIVNPGQQVSWPGTNINFGIINLSGPDALGAYRFKIWFTDNKGEPSIFWVENETDAVITRSDTDYLFTTKEHYATGLQVARDPGVWPVYIGCMLMIFGLYVAFFLSHRRIWAYITKEDSKTLVILGGLSNKNKIGFENDFTTIVEALDKKENTTSSKE